MKKTRKTELTFWNIINSEFGAFTRIIWNGVTIFEDKDDGTFIEGKLLTPTEDKTTQEMFLDFFTKWGDKQIYNFYCRIHSFHHTELYIEGEN